MIQQPEHIEVSNDEVGSTQRGGRYFFLPGSPSRAKVIADKFEDCKVFPGRRGHDVYTGVLRLYNKGKIDVGVVATGMGCPSLGIIVSELIMLGIRRFLRVGTAGSLQPQVVRTADVVIVTGAVRDEGTSLAYAPAEVPALASIEMVECLVSAAENLGLVQNAHVGLVHTKDSLYGREFMYGPMSEESERYMERLQSTGVLASEMEASHLFILTQTNQKLDKVIKGPLLYSTDKSLSGCILAITGEGQSFGEEEQRKIAVERAIAVSIEAVRVLYLRENT
jgi:uridine phosphorylase